MACSKCTYGCTGACAPGCTGECGTGCTGACGGCSYSCSGTCTSCEGCSGCTGCTSCSGCSNTCTATCADSCNNNCKNTCTGACTNTCKNYCNQGCSGSAMNLTLDTYFTAENAQAIADAIIFEIGRRPNASTPINTTNLFTDGKVLTATDVNKLITNLSKTGKTVTSATQGTTAERSLGESIIAKLLEANEENIPIA